MKLTHAVSAVVLTSLGCATASPTPTPSAAPSAHATIGTYTSDASGFDTHSFWLDTGREVVVFDAQFTPKLAEDVVHEIERSTASPIKYVVITHPNPDKFNGASVFRAHGAKVVASAHTAAAMPDVHAYKKSYFVGVGMFTDATYPALPPVDVTFEGKMSLPLEGSTKVELIELAHAGVSSTQTVAWVPSEKAVFVGDLVHHKAHAWLEGGIVHGKPQPDLVAWKAALGELSAFEGARVYGGRGETAPVATAVTAQTAYLDKVDAIVTAYAKEVGAAKPDYKELARRASAAYPDYALPYMIEYGAYGLFMQRAR